MTGMAFGKYAKNLPNAQRIGKQTDKLINKTKFVYEFEVFMTGTEQRCFQYIHDTALRGFRIRYV